MAPDSIGDGGRSSAGNTVVNDPIPLAESRRQRSIGQTLG